MKLQFIFINNIQINIKLQSFSFTCSLLDILSSNWQAILLQENDSLRPFLAEAIAACCVSRETGLLFGQAGAVAPLVQ